MSRNRPPSAGSQAHKTLRQNELRNNLTGNFSIIDLFAGVGGLSLGAARAGFEVVLAAEKDKHAIAAHTKNFPKTKHIDDDIAELTGENLLKESGLKLGELDGLIGGPPCQGFSTIGHRHVSDPRNNLFRKFFSLVSECSPKFYMAENVLGILDKQYEDIRNAALDVVRSEYIVLAPIQFKASNFGAATSRERAFFIGYRKDLKLELSAADFEPPKMESATTVSKALRGLPRIFSTWLSEEQGWRWLTEPMPSDSFGERITNGIPKDVGDPEAIRRLQQEGSVSGCLGTRHSREIAARYRSLKAGEQDRVSKSVRLDPGGLCPTLRAGTGPDKGSYQAVRPIHPTSARVITPREAARLQGFPDWFQFAPSKWHSFRQIGNSVSPFVAEAVLSVIKARLLAVKT
jgi:DNA (cytosine-5)-methyltransferase 1